MTLTWPSNRLLLGRVGIRQDRLGLFRAVARSRSRTPSSERATIAAASSAALTAPARPSRASDRHSRGHLDDREQRVHPFRVFDSTGTPRTGRLVFDAAIPGRCAAPPAPAIRPAGRAPPPSPRTRRGGRGPVRRDDLLLERDLERLERLAAWRIVSQSEREPMITPTTAVTWCGPASAARSRRLSRSCAAPRPARRRGEPVEDEDRLALRRAVLQHDDAEPPHRKVGSLSRSCSSARIPLTSPGGRERALRARSAPSRARPGYRPAARAVRARASGGSEWRSRGRRGRGSGSRRSGRVLELLVPLLTEGCERRLVAGGGELIGPSRGLGRFTRSRRPDAYQDRRSARTAARAGSASSARGCAPTSRRFGSRRTSRVRAPAGPRRRRARPPTRTRRSSRADGPVTSSAAPRAPRPRVVGDLVARRAELFRRLLEQACAWILGAVDAVAEAHQPLAALDQPST